MNQGEARVRPDPHRGVLAKLVAKTRREKRLRLIDVAANAKLSTSYVWGVENGEIQSPGIDNLKALLKALGIPQDEGLLAAGHVPPDVLAALRRGGRPLLDKVRQWGRRAA